MAPDPEESQGIGTPSESQPGFAPHGGQQPPWAPPPQSPAWPPPQAPAGKGPSTPPPAPHQWSAPDPRLVIPAPPTGRGPRHVRRPRFRLVAVSLAITLVLVAALGTLPLLTPTPVTPQSSTTPVPVATETPSARPANASTATSGGDLGTPVAFRSESGSGSVTVNSVVWTDAGEMAAPTGQRYLVVDLTVACSQGVLPVDPLMFLAVTGDDKVLPAFGPTLTTPLGGQVVKAGRTARGQVGYVLAPGTVTLDVLDPDLRPVAEIRIPAP